MNRTSFCAAVLLICFLTVSVLPGADRGNKEHFAIGEVMNYPQQGIRFRTLRKCRPSPLAAVKKMYDVGDIAHECEYVDIHEIWTSRQTLVNMISEDGSRVVAYVPSLPLPTGIKLADYDNGQRQCLLLTDFVQWARNSALPDDFDFHAWAEYAAGPDWHEITEELKLKSKELDLRIFSRDAGSYMVEAVSKKDHNLRLMLVYSFAQHANKSDKQIRRVLSSLIMSIVLSQPQTQKATAVRQIPTGKKKSDRQTSDAYERSRERVIHSVKNVPGWWYMETEYFIIASNIKRQKDINFFKGEVDNVYAVYQKLMPPIAEINAVSVIRVFDDNREYLFYTGQKNWSAGVWIPAKHELVFFLEHDSSRKEQSYQRERVLHHEMFHQYLFYAVNGMMPHVWFNEGCAEYFEKIVCKSAGKYSLQLDKEYLERAANAVKSSPYGDVKPLLKLSYDDFYNDYKRTYDAAFALIIFLMQGAEQVKDPALRRQYLAIPYRYYKVCAETGDREQASKMAWSDIDMDVFVREFKRFWSDKKNYGKLKSDKLIPVDESRETKK